MSVPQSSDSEKGIAIGELYEALRRPSSQIEISCLVSVVKMQLNWTHLYRILRKKSFVRQYGLCRSARCCCRNVMVVDATVVVS